ncbi:ATP-binding cassette domain-containing protein, partial [Candidatus Dojkabacteria bacterium]|nr:ATP-binding cassette domain-containing protein [Candidatus Dojkabacteria bacterium]
EDKTAYENVAFAMEAAGKKPKEIKEAVPYVLDVVGLTNRMKAFPVQLSGGEQQRVAIARAIANNPKILIADEPTGNLDPASAWDIVQVLAKINNWGTTVIMSTHGTDIVNTLNKRVIQMENGNIVRDDNEGQYEFSTKKEEEELKEIMEEVHNEPEKKAKTSFKVNLSSPKKTGVGQEEFEEESSEKPNKRGFLSKLFGGDSKAPENIETQNASTESKEDTDELIEDEIPPVKVEEETDSKDVSIKKTSKTEIETKTDGESESEEKSEEKVNVTTGLASSRKKTEDVSNKKDEKGKGISKTLQKKLNEYSEMEVNFLNLPKSLIKQLQKDGYDTIGKILEDGPEALTDKINIDPEEVIMIAKALEKVVKDS